MWFAGGSWSKLIRFQNYTMQGAPFSNSTPRAPHGLASRKCSSLPKKSLQPRLPHLRESITYCQTETQYVNDRTRSIYLLEDEVTRKRKLKLYK